MIISNDTTLVNEPTAIDQAVNRRPDGQFAKGNPGGNHSLRAMELKDAYQHAITQADMRKNAERLLKMR